MSSVRPCVCPSVILFPRYPRCTLMDIYQSFVNSAPFRLDLDFGVKRSKVRVTAWPSARNTIFRHCFHDVSGMHRWIFIKFLSLLHIGTKMNCLVFGVKRSKVKVTASQEMLRARRCVSSFNRLVLVSFVRDRSFSVIGPRRWRWPIFRFTNVASIGIL